MLREEVIKSLALLEALIDFGEGEDLEEGIYDQGLSLLDSPSTLVAKRFITAVGKARGLLRTIKSHLADARRGEIVRSGIHLSIFGPPNAGKSSLLNFLCKYLNYPRLSYKKFTDYSSAQRDAAIVTPIPGTTRDVLSLSLDIGGLPVIISDTAGIRQTRDVVENIGIERAHQA